LSSLFISKLYKTKGLKMATIFELMENTKLFQTKYFKEHEDMFTELAEKGQNPQVLFIGCSDSRVMPDIMIDTKPGDLFVVRNIGNFVPLYKPDEDYHGTAAGIEYAVNVLKVKDIIVCGHSHCGACEALYRAKPKNLPHVNKWLELGNKAKKAVKFLASDKSQDEIFRLTERISVIFQLDNLLSYPYIKDKVKTKEIHLHGWYFSIESGTIEYYDRKEEIYKPLASYSENEKK
jgi:carbonic anhydrase